MATASRGQLDLRSWSANGVLGLSWNSAQPGTCHPITVLLDFGSATKSQQGALRLHRCRCLASTSRGATARRHGVHTHRPREGAAARGSTPPSLEYTCSLWAPRQCRTVPTARGVRSTPQWRRHWSPSPALSWLWVGAGEAGRLPGNVRNPSPELTVSDAEHGLGVCAVGRGSAPCPVVAQPGWRVPSKAGHGASSRVGPLPVGCPSLQAPLPTLQSGRVEPGVMSLSSPRLSFLGHHEGLGGPSLALTALSGY